MFNSRKKENQKRTRVLLESILYWIKAILHLNKKRIIVLLCLALMFFIGNMVFENIDLLSKISVKKITPIGLNNISEDTFRKIIGYNYGEKMYLSDTAEIKNKLQDNASVFGDISFNIKYIPLELEIKLTEVSPLFASSSVVYSDKGEIYPYHSSLSSIPVVDIKDSADLNITKEFLIELRSSDRTLFDRVSQVVSDKKNRQIEVYFNDVRFKTLFPLEGGFKDAFRRYRQLTRNPDILGIDSVYVLDLRFPSLAYTKRRY